MKALVLAAGKGTRMKSRRPKVLQEIFSRPVLDYVLSALIEAGIRDLIVVVGNGADQVRAFLEKKQKETGVKIRTVWQREQKGTGHAVLMAEKLLGSSQDDVLVWPGDMPLVKPETVKDFIRTHKNSRAEVSVLSGLEVEETTHGRILRAAGRFYAIREYSDASELEKRTQEINTGIYFFKRKRLFEALSKIRPVNVQKEYYLTDTIEFLANDNCQLEAFPLASSNEAYGINSREDLAMVTKVIARREIQYHQGRGVTFVAPDQTFVEPGVKIGRDTVIYPWCYIEGGVEIGPNCQIGPFAKIRKGTRIEVGSVVGSFVEVNRSHIGKNVLAKHLAYLGDAVVGDGTNIGAGTITANFDGKRKHLTRIGKKVLVGSNTVFVAPVVVGDKARTGAGSVVTGGSRVKKGEVVVGVPAKPLKKVKRKG